MEEKKYDIVETRHGSFKTNLIKKFATHKAWVRPNPKEIKSFIPGTVVEILVKEGQKVKAGDKLMVYKAMKMHNNIIAEADGTVKKLHVKEGDNLPNRAVMIEME